MLQIMITKGKGPSLTVNARFGGKTARNLKNKTKTDNLFQVYVFCVYRYQCAAV